jgi:hypothetical protein
LRTHHLPIFGEIIASEKAEENYVVVDSDPKSGHHRELPHGAHEPGIRARCPRDKGKVVMVTSYRPNEGQDLLLGEPERDPGQGRQEGAAAGTGPAQTQGGYSNLGMNSTTVGLSNVLIGKATWRQVVLPTQFENFSVILSGPTPPNASELVLSKHLAATLRMRPTPNTTT